MNAYDALRARTDLEDIWKPAGEDGDGNPVFYSPAVQTALSEGLITQLDAARALMDFSVGSSCVCSDKEGEACPTASSSFFSSAMGEDPSDGALMVSARAGKVYLSFLFEKLPDGI